MLLRGFLDLVALRVREKMPDPAAILGAFSQSWPDQIEISMERNISVGTFPGDGVQRAILVELTPVGIAPDPPQQQVDARDAAGRVDATIVVRQSQSDVLAIVIESKLYGRAGHEQLMRYKQALERKIPTVHVEVTWEDIYALADSLPEAAEHDPIIGDFKSFLARDPRLVGFTAFRDGDFTGPGYLLDLRLQKLCETLVGRNADPLLRAERVERKRGGLDYDILLAEQSRLIGNIGLACWEQDALYAKLVIGSRSRWETNRAIDSSVAADYLSALIRRLASRADLRIGATVRPFFNKFQYPYSAQWRKVIQKGEDPSDAWRSMIEFARDYHARPLDQESLLRLQREPVATSDQESLNKALEQNDRVKCFVLLGVETSWKPEYLSRLKPEELIRVVSETLVDLSVLLRLLSGIS